MIILGPASYAQAHIWLDERASINPERPKVAIYNMPFVYRLSTGGILSITQLRRALQQVVMKHKSLRTSLIFNVDENILMQRIIEPTGDDKNQLYAFIESIITTDEDLHGIVQDERDNPNHFDVSRGLVFRCHIVRQQPILHDDLFGECDSFIFNFYHACFDLFSIDVFNRDLAQAYTTSQLADDDMALRYIDC